MISVWLYKLRRVWVCKLRKFLSKKVKRKCDKGFKSSDLLISNYLISINMLPRIVRIPLRYQYSAVSKPQFSNVPQVMNQT